VGAASALPDADSAVTCRPDLDRAEDPEVLAAALRTAGVDDVTAGDDVAAALETAVERADLGDCVLLVGSLFAVAEARAARMRTVTPRTVSGSDPDANAARALDIGGVPTGDESGASRRRREDRPPRPLPPTARRPRGAPHGRPPRGRRRRRDRGPRRRRGSRPGRRVRPRHARGNGGEYRELLGRLREREGEEFAGIAGDIADRVGIDDSDAADSAPRRLPLDRRYRDHGRAQRHAGLLPRRGDTRAPTTRSRASSAWSRRASMSWMSAASRLGRAPSPCRSTRRSTGSSRRLRRSISAGGRRQQRANLGGYAEASRRGGCARRRRRHHQRRDRAGGPGDAGGRRRRRLPGRGDA